MSDISVATEQGNAVAQGTDGRVGQPETGTETPVGQPKNKVPTQGQPVASQELSETLTLEKLAASERDYKALQTEFAKRNESDKSLQERFSKFGGVEKVNQYMDFFTNNPRFAEWLQEEQKRELLGDIDITNMDDEQKQALNVVQKLAQQVSKQMTDQLYKEKIQPLADTYKEQLMDKSFAKMDENHPNWREMQTEMEKLGSHLPKHIQDNPQYEDFEDLYFKSLRVTGKFDDYAASLYQKKLEKKKANSSDSPPTTTGKGMEKPPTNIVEAFQRAKKKLGITGEVTY